jgi:hypothetical protein
VPLLYQQFDATPSARPAFFRLNEDLLPMVRSRAQMIPKLKEFRRPVRIIFGDADPSLNSGVARTFHEFLPGSELFLIAGARSGSQNHRRFPQRQRPRHQEGLCAIRRLVPQDGAADESERRDRRQQVQGGELARQQLHEGKDGTAPAQIEESVARYLSQLDTADRQTAAGEAPSEELAARTTRLKEKLTKLEEEVKRRR